MIVLKIVDESTFDAVIDLTVSSQDERRLAPNVYSLAQAWLLRERKDLTPYAIVAGGNPVGFLLLNKDTKKREYYLWRLMIGSQYQNFGYGKEAVRQVIQKARQDATCDHLVVSYVMGNHRMRGLLESLGFQSAGLSGNEIVMTLNVK